MKPIKWLTEVDRRTRQSRATSLARDRSQISLTLKLISFQRHSRRTLHIYVLYCNPITVAPDELPMSMQSKYNNLREAEVPPRSPPIPSPVYYTVLYCTHTISSSGPSALAQHLPRRCQIPCGLRGRSPSRRLSAAPHCTAKAVAPERWEPCSHQISTPLEKKSQQRPKPPQRTPHRMHFHEGTYHDCQHTAMLARI